MNRSLYSSCYDSLRSWLIVKRQEKGISIRALADLQGRHHSIIGKIEQSRRKIDIVEFVEYCKTLDVDPHEGLDVIISNIDAEKIIEPPWAIPVSIIKSGCTCQIISCIAIISDGY